jgi:uncharacterized membrane protein
LADIRKPVQISQGSVLPDGVLPPHERENIVHEVLVQVSRFFSGPLPSPEILADYERLTPGMADRVVRMAEEQSAHRRQLEAGALNHNQTLASRAQWLGYSLALIMLVGGMSLVAIDKPVAGLLVVATAVGAILGSTWFGKHATLKELRDKARGLESVLPVPPPSN